MKIRREVRKEEGFKVCLELFQRSADPECAWQSIPASRSIVRKGSFTQGSLRLRGRPTEPHVKRACKDKFVGKKSGCSTVKTAEHKDKCLEVESLLNVKPV